MLDRRYYQRTFIGLESNFIIHDNESGNREFVGIIEDISEGGIRIHVKEDAHKDVVATIRKGSVISFQSYDEYELYQEKKQEVFMGEVEVLRVDKTSEGLFFGCKLIRLTRDLEEYIKNKKIAVYISDF